MIPVSSSLKYRCISILFMILSLFIANIALVSFESYTFKWWGVVMIGCLFAYIAGIFIGLANYKDKSDS